MMFIRHVGALVLGGVRYGTSIRSLTFVLTIVGGLLVLLLALTTQLATPYVLYPFV